MHRLLIISTTLAATLCTMSAVVAQQALPPPPASNQSPWNSHWDLNTTRNSVQIKDGAAQDYRFHVYADGRLRWEIPSLHELAEGRLGGVPIMIHRPGTSGLAIAVKAEGPRVLTYRVTKNGIPEGKGRMTLVEQDRSWVDITEPAGRPDLASVVIYSKAPD